MSVPSPSPSPSTRPQAQQQALAQAQQQALAVQPPNVRPTPTQRLAALTGVQPKELVDAVKAQCFGNDAAKVTDASLIAFLSVAADLGINPLLPGMLYAYWHSQLNRFVPIMGPDAVYKKLAEHPLYEGNTAEFGYDEGSDDLWCKVTIFVKGWKVPITEKCYLSEWGEKTNKNPNWRDRPRHMLKLRTLKQAARQLIHGIPQWDDDDIIDVQFTQPAPPLFAAVPAVPAAAPAPAPAPAPARKKVEAAKKADPPPQEQVQTALPSGLKATPRDILADFRDGLTAMAKKENETEDDMLRILGSKRAFADFTEDDLDAVIEAQGLCEQYGWGPPP
jgi:hypothetical protein